MDDKPQILILTDDKGSLDQLVRLLTDLNYNSLIIKSLNDKINYNNLTESSDLIFIDIHNGHVSQFPSIASSLKTRSKVPIITLLTSETKAKLDSINYSLPFLYAVKPINKFTLDSIINMAVSYFQTEKKLLESEQRYKSLVEKSPNAIGIHCEGKIVYANNAALKLLGAKNHSELIGTDIINIVHPEFRDLVANRSKNILRYNKIEEAAYEKFIRLDGKIIDVEVVALPTTFMGKPAVQITISDISELKKRERIQQVTLNILNHANSASSLNQLFNLIHNDLSGLVKINNFFIAIYDQEKKTITFPYYKDEFKNTPKDRKFGKGIIEYVIKSGKTVSLNKDEIEILRETGEVEMKSKGVKNWIGIPLKVGNSILGVLVIKEYNRFNSLRKEDKELLELIAFPVARAIERKMIEKERELYTKQLQELNITKDKFFSVISHDLRSPFNSILGFTEILQNEYNEISEDERKLFISSLYESTRNVFSLLNNLLQYSRFQMGLIDFNPKKTSLLEMIIKNVELFKISAKEKNVTLRHSLEYDIPVLAEEDILDSIFRNLISNALKYTDSGGFVTLEAKQNDGFVEISVSDSGVGMDEEVIEGLFKLENKQSLPGTKNEKGTGLGLILTKEFVEKHGGQIKVDSKPGQGSRISFTLPLFKYD